MARKILLADDSVTAQNMGRKILEDAGYDVTTVNNGSAALKRIAEQKPDLVILDVYMPGYGGLEVCQRLRENSELARIPILLTVGKLEPFKADEARRVKADAFIVKPFEANELITALTKLEDRIVPAAEGVKRGRFASAIASVEKITGKGGQKDGFGDADAGWKNRINIPSVKPKPDELEAEPDFAAVSTATRDMVLRDLERDQRDGPSKLKVTYEDRPVADPSVAPLPPFTSALPGDITMEEISAITAAAATLNRKQEEPIAPVIATMPKGPVLDLLAKAMEIVTATPEIANSVSQSPTQTAPLTVSQNIHSLPTSVETEPHSGTEAIADQPQLPFVTPSDVKNEYAISAEPRVSDVPDNSINDKGLQSAASQTSMSGEIVASGAPVAEPQPIVEISVRETRVRAATDDAEVLAALASLTPSDGGAFAPDASLRREKSGPEDRRKQVAPDRRKENRGVPMARAVAREGSFSPRWIASETAVLSEEATLLLDQEMQHAYQASVAAEISRREGLPILVKPEDSVVSITEAQVQLATSFVKSTVMISDPAKGNSGNAFPEVDQPAINSKSEGVTASSNEFKSDKNVLSMAALSMAPVESSNNASSRVSTELVELAKLQELSSMAVPHEETSASHGSGSSIDVQGTRAVEDLSHGVAMESAPKTDFTASVKDLPAAAITAEFFESVPNISETKISESEIDAARAVPKLLEFVHSDPKEIAFETVRMVHDNADSKLGERPRSVSEKDLIPAPNPASETVAQEKPMAHAAVASAGATSLATETKESSNSSSEVAAINPPSVGAHVQKRETELAAAWASWRQIRETTPAAPSVNDQATVQEAEMQPAVEVKHNYPEAPPVMDALEEAEPAIPESDSPKEVSALGFRDLRREPSAEPKVPEEMAVQAEGENEGDVGDISSMVDSMLADLKPKLMEEIARKMKQKKE